MSQAQAGIPFRMVVDLCARHDFQLMRTVGDVRVFHRPGHYDVSAPHTWVSVEIEADRTVRLAVYRRLQDFFQDYGVPRACQYGVLSAGKSVQVG